MAVVAALLERRLGLIMPARAGRDRLYLKGLWRANAHKRAKSVLPNVYMLAIRLMRFKALNRSASSCEAVPLCVSIRPTAVDLMFSYYHPEPGAL